MGLKLLLKVTLLPCPNKIMKSLKDTPKENSVSSLLAEPLFNTSQKTTKENTRLLTWSYLSGPSRTRTYDTRIMSPLL